MTLFSFHHGLLSLFCLIKKVTKKIKKIRFLARGYPPSTDFHAYTLLFDGNLFLIVIPVSDSGKAEEAWALRLPLAQKSP